MPLHPAAWGTSVCESRAYRKQYPKVGQQTVLGSAGQSECMRGRWVLVLREEMAVGRKDNGGTEEEHLALRRLAPSSQ